MFRNVDYVRVMYHLQPSTNPIHMSTRNLNTTPIFCHKGWRLANGYPRQWSDRGILTDGPDYTFADGKPTPYTNGQRQRLQEQRKYAVNFDLRLYYFELFEKERILYLLDVVRYAKQTYQERIKNYEDKKQVIIERKLKPKGNLLKKKSIK